MIARIILALALCVTPIITTGCATSTAQHPGSINTFDSQAYDALLTLQAGIEEAKVQFANTPAAKEPLDKVRAAYNTTMNAYKVWHAAASSDPAAQQALANQITAVKSSLASLLSTFGGKP